MTDRPGGSAPHDRDAADRRDRVRILAAVIASISIVGVTFGLTSPLLSVLLERQGYSYTMISLNTAMGAAGSIAIAPLLPACSPTRNPWGGGRPVLLESETPSFPGTWPRSGQKVWR